MNPKDALQMSPQDALKLLEISVNLASEIMQVKADDQLSETEWKNMFSSCVDLVHEKFRSLPTCERELRALDEKFATISEMHRIFSEKITNVEKKLATLPLPRASRRP